jgi:basic membrane protein A
MQKNTLKGLSVLLVTLMLGGCASNNSNKQTDNNETAAKKIKIAMCTDTGGINDQAFNQSAWEGLKDLKKENPNIEIKYLESKQTSDNLTNLEAFADEDQDLIFAIGYSQETAVKSVAEKNPDKPLVLVDTKFSEEQPDNTTAIDYKSQEVSFLVGYVAARTTKTNKVAFVGGMRSETISKFECGFKAGVKHGAKELGKDISCEVQYAESYSDPAKGKAIASKLFNSGSDIIFHACSDTGSGVIECAKENGKLAIGVDRDQSSLAPENILTSAIKNVGASVKLVAEKFMKEGKTSIAKKTFEYGLKEGTLGIPETNKNMDPAIYKDTMALREKIISGEIVPPANEAEYNEFIKTL